jgi:hypothetical protein
MLGSSKVGTATHHLTVVPRVTQIGALHPCYFYLPSPIPCIPCALRPPNRPFALASHFPGRPTVKPSLEP